MLLIRQKLTNEVPLLHSFEDLPLSVTQRPSNQVYI